MLRLYLESAVAHPFAHSAKGWGIARERDRSSRLPRTHPTTPLTTSRTELTAAPSSTSTHPFNICRKPVSDFAANPNLLSPVSTAVQVCSPGVPRLHSAHKVRTVPQSSTHISCSRHRSSRHSSALAPGIVNSTSNVECADLFQTPSSSKTKNSFPSLMRVPSGAPSLIRMSPYNLPDDASGTLFTRIRAGSIRVPQTTSPTPFGSRRTHAVQLAQRISPAPSPRSSMPHFVHARRASGQSLKAVAAMPRFHHVASSSSFNNAAFWLCCRLACHSPRYFAASPRLYSLIAICASVLPEISDGSFMHSVYRSDEPPRRAQHLC